MILYHFKGDFDAFQDKDAFSDPPGSIFEGMLAHVLIIVEGFSGVFLRPFVEPFSASPLHGFSSKFLRFCLARAKR